MAHLHCVALFSSHVRCIHIVQRRPPTTAADIAFTTGGTRVGLRETLVTGTAGQCDQYGTAWRRQNILASAPALNRGRAHCLRCSEHSLRRSPIASCRAFHGTCTAKHDECKFKRR